MIVQLNYQEAYNLAMTTEHSSSNFNITIAPSSEHSEEFNNFQRPKKGN